MSGLSPSQRRRGRLGDPRPTLERLWSLDRHLPYTRSRTEVLADLRPDSIVSVPQLWSFAYIALRRVLSPRDARALGQRVRGDRDLVLCTARSRTAPADPNAGVAVFE